MALIIRRPTTPSQRFTTLLDRRGLSSARPEKSLIRPWKRNAGRNAEGRVTVRHQGGGEKRYLRIVDYRREKTGVPAVVVSLEYDPNRSADIALLHYADGEKRYIIAPDGLSVGNRISSGPEADVKPGNALPFSKLPLGTIVHNLETRIGAGGQIARGAGAAAMIMNRDGGFVTVKLPSGEVRRIDERCYATVGQVGNMDLNKVSLGKAGRKIHMGIRPTVRGVAQNPDSHPHGGGEGRSGIGMPSPKSPWGKKTLGKRTRKRIKYSSKLIVSRRKKKNK